MGLKLPALLDSEHQLGCQSEGYSDDHQDGPPVHANVTLMGGLPAFLVSLWLTSEWKSPWIPRFVSPTGCSPHLRCSRCRSTLNLPLVSRILTLRLSIPTATPWSRILERPLQNCLSSGPKDRLRFCEVCKVPKTSPVLRLEQPMEAMTQTPPTPQWHHSLRSLFSLSQPV